MFCISCFHDAENAKWWIDKVFGILEPSEMLCKRDCSLLGGETDLGCIINNPKDTMRNPLLGVDLAATVGTVMKVVNEPCSQRLKPLLVTVRGTGGGKSRLFEELRRSLYNNKTILPIGITFNSKATMINIEFACDTSTQSAALSVITRMASVFFGVNFGDMLMVVQSQLKFLDQQFAASYLYSTFLNMILQKMIDADAAVKGVVLFIDEILQFQMVLRRYYAEQTSEDNLNPLRQVFLDETPNCALAVSSLSSCLEGFTFSGRRMEPLRQCEVLNATEVAIRWWNIPANDTVQVRRFARIAAVLCDLPRGLEFAEKFIGEHRGSQANSEFVSELFESVQETILTMYTTTSSPPSPQLLYSMWYRTHCLLDEEARTAILCSLLTNVLVTEEIMKSSRNMTTAFLPRANLLMLALCSTESTDFSSVFKPLVFELMRNAIRLNEHALQEGFILERHALLVLSARIGVAMNADVATTAGKLLGLDPIKPKLAPALGCELILQRTMIPFWSYDVPKMKFSTRSKGGSLTAAVRQRFLKELDSIDVSDLEPLAIRRSAEGESFDFVMKVRDLSVPQGAHYIFVDQKSVGELHRLEESHMKDLNIDPITLSYVPFKTSQLPKRGSQVDHMSLVMPNNYSFAFVYQTTHDIKQVNLQNCIYAGRKQTKSFMGPVWELYRAMRASLE